VRLTRRGRAVALLASVVLLLLAVAVSGRVTAQAGDVLPAGPATAVVVVQPGETLWQIAKTLAPQGDPRALVSEIRELNGLSDAPVRPGQSLVVPALG
jgi:LysM repeat protein